MEMNREQRQYSILETERRLALYFQHGLISDGAFRESLDRSGWDTVLAYDTFDGVG